MTSASRYRQQWAWRDWPRLLAALPPLGGQTVLDLGCGVGDLAAELAARGARVIGLDINEELLAVARARGVPNAEFRSADLRAPLVLGEPVDGLWASFSPAYFPDLPAALARWTIDLRPGGWVALTEIDDFFGHEPLSQASREGFAAYAHEALAAGRYDFHMGGKLAGLLAQAGFVVERAFSVEDAELSFTGPALPEVIEAWRQRLDGMQLLRERCGLGFEAVREEFLACLSRPDHRSRARVCFCLATRPLA